MASVRRRRMAALTAPLLALAASPVGAPPAGAQEAAAVARPAASTEPPWTARAATRDGRPYVYLEAPPGTVLEDALSLTNPGDRPVTLRVRAGAPWAGWVRFAADRVTVPPRTRADVPFTVTVPPDAPPGDRPGTLLVRTEAGAEARAEGTRSGREAVVPVRLRVGGPRLAALTVEDVSVTAGGIRYALVNRGNTVLEPRLAVRADGLFGEVLRRGARALPLRLAPGRRVELTEPWPGRDRPPLDRVTVRLDATADGVTTRAEAAATRTFVSRGGAAGAGGALLAVAAGAAARALRRRRRGERWTRDRATGAVG
ncbi:hypothetical protein [Streptomyces sp. NPDC047928]|uniref:hypothetical protein n=1 Tax=unclassified Streptomyces TaxID=2593676 RepID=UPI00371C9B65